MQTIFSLLFLSSIPFAFTDKLGPAADFHDVGSPCSQDGAVGCASDQTSTVNCLNDGKLFPLFHRNLTWQTAVECVIQGTLCQCNGQSATVCSCVSISYTEYQNCFEN